MNHYCCKDLLRVTLMTMMCILGPGTSGQAAANNGGEFAIVAHPSSGATNVSINDIRDLYLGKVRELPGAGLVFPIDLASTGSLHDDFVERILEKSAKEFSSYWAVRIFTGRGTPPLTVADEKSAKEWIQNHKDAVGYMRLKDVDQSVKVILKLP